MPALTLQHVDGIAVITIDLPGEPVNKVTAGLRAELAGMFSQLEGDTGVKSIVLLSGKPDTWLAGADIDEFLTLESAADAEALSRGGQSLLARLEGLKIPVVAAIHGACLGAGLETALACHYRIATDHPKTILALPEVQLGLVPGAGGTQRLPRLIGLQLALDMILTSRNVRAKKAYQTGLVDELVHPEILRDIALDRARKLAARTLDVQHSPKSRGATNRLLEDNPIGRAIVFKKAREGVLAKTHGHYPAPLAAIGAVQAGYERGSEAGYREEARAFGEMAVSDVSKQLVFLFFATTSLKKDSGVSGPAPDAAPIATLGIIGSGFMGAGIASVAVQQQTPVRLKDTDTTRVGRGLA
ncbi:MAG: enoyl-CoA hydratase-related protein, partial [bacterium]